MEPIKSNQLSNQYPPLDLAEIKSQPLKLIKITSLMVVKSSFLGLHIFLPMLSSNHAVSGGFLPPHPRFPLSPPQPPLPSIINPPYPASSRPRSFIFCICYQGFLYFSGSPSTRRGSLCNTYTNQPSLISYGFSPTAIEEEFVNHIIT
ncbi:hypothetical protein Hanom_Chr12g01077621 [Helianthus anomalus]